MSYYDEITKAIYAIYEYISKNAGTLFTGTAAVTQVTLLVVETVVVEAVPSPHDRCYNTCRHNGI